MSSSQSMFSRAIAFVKNDIWSINIKKVSQSQSFLIRLLRVIIIAVRGFNEDRCIEKASALSYYTLFSLVPIVAMAFGIAKGFGFEVYLEQYLQSMFADKQEVLAQVLEFTDSMLSNTKGGLIAGIGVVVLMWSVIKVLGKIEMSLNEIWDVKKQRTLVRKVSDYLTIALLTPLFIIISSNATTKVAQYVATLQESMPWVSEVYGLVSLILNLLPYSLMWFAFASIYIVMPNTKVSLKSAFLGGAIAGIVFQIVQFLYIKFQIGMSSYNAVYGSFAAIPLFLFWMQTSWVIVLMGAEIAYATQNQQNFEFEFETKQLSQSLRMRLSILLLHSIIKRFEEGLSPQTATQIAAVLDIPHRIASVIIHGLIDANLIRETKTHDEKVFGYVPAMSIEKLNAQTCFDALQNAGINTIELQETAELQRINEIYNSLCIENNILLKDV